ncbi:MAG TPA: helix-turn-helix transcriptional regulator [Trebonia sp.]|nr:helix-turn-helix transcriptional regulator [Trebonia sp.]
MRTVLTPREQLAETLKQARIDAGYGTHGALAKKLNLSRPVITRAENPSHPVPSDAVLAAWAGATGIGLDTLTDLAERAKSGTPDWFVPYVVAERNAATLRCWSHVLVPGLVQCEAYARAVLSVERYAPERLDELVRARMERQQALDRASLTVILDAHVLQRCIGSPAIMAEQCAYLASLAERPDIALHTVPEGANVGLYGSFSIAAQDGNMTILMETLQDVPTTAPGVCELAVRQWERILGAARNLDDSLSFVQTQEESWKAQI